MSPPLISVIMIFLDAEGFIEEAIASVFAQTWPNWELLLVDDSSSDRSTGIAKDVAARHPDRVRYLEHPGHANRGMSASRNLGLAHAQGELVAFLDADDVYLPERLEGHVALFAAHPEAGMVQGGAVYWHGWAGDGRADAPEPVVELDPGRITQPPALLRLLVATQGTTAPTAIAITARRGSLMAVGGFEEDFRGLYEDQVIFAKLYLTTDVLIDPTHVALYRQHSQSCSGQARDEAGLVRERQARRAFLDWLRREVRTRAPEERELIAIVEHELENPNLQSWLSQPGFADPFLAWLRSRFGRVLPPTLYQQMLEWRGAQKYQRYEARLAQARAWALGRAPAPRNG